MVGGDEYQPKLRPPKRPQLKIIPHWPIEGGVRCLKTDFGTHAPTPACGTLKVLQTCRVPVAGHLYRKGGVDDAHRARLEAQARYHKRTQTQTAGQNWSTCRHGLVRFSTDCRTTRLVPSSACSYHRSASFSAIQAPKPILSYMERIRRTGKHCLARSKQFVLQPPRREIDTDI